MTTKQILSFTQNVFILIAQRLPIEHFPKLSQHGSVHMPFMFTDIENMNVPFADVRF